MTYTADQFTSYEREYPDGHGTAADKAKFANKLVRFIDSGFKETLFTRYLYRNLSNCFGHIAHYDIHGFYSTWFSDSTSRCEWFHHVLTHPVYGDPEFTFVDVEKVIREYVMDNDLWHKATAVVFEEVEKQEREELLRLKQKYEGAGPKGNPYDGLSEKARRMVDDDDFYIRNR